MKKLLAILLACSAFAFAMTGCSDKKEENSKSEDEYSNSDSSSEASEEEETVEATTKEIPSIEEGLVDDALIGSWFNEYMGGSYLFKEDNTLSMELDYAEIMYFKGDKLILGEYEIDYETDGKKVSVIADYEALNVEPPTDENGSATADKYEILIMERKEESDSIDGTYKLTGGEIFTMFKSIYGSIEMEPSLSIIVDGESLKLIVDMCEYSADGKTLQMFGEGAAIFGLGDEDPKCEYSIDGDTLSLTDKFGVTDTFTKN
ncbi:MAG: hypothetical protein E7497_07670 [Ruminococcus sp.]|nr:hypothetical protein [Ruminococcus sp.]